MCIILREMKGHSTFGRWTADATKKAGRKAGAQPQSAHNALVVVLVLARRFFQRSEGLYYVEAANVDCFGVGRTSEDAEQDFAVAFEIRLRGWQARGTLDERLTELGFLRDIWRKQPELGLDYDITLFRSPETPAMRPRHEGNLEEAEVDSVFQTIPFQVSAARTNVV